MMQLEEGYKIKKGKPLEEFLHVSNMASIH